ncbi:hypothetical protein DICVIV_01591 [Dictyocaulus viviparus]|uniref:Uncharacterized protein n=1 Tax=Dictyocaulus viviparus TaxID=29172 RepID=A0A0D8Y604_DICVI|nr:hypothetical protein DICVIV_01591 [Dictyocaulus viviparus]
MNLIKHEKKLGSGAMHGQSPLYLCRAVIYGGSIIVFDERSSAHLCYYGSYGCFINERQDRINNRIFSKILPRGNVLEEQLSEAAQTWNEKSPLRDCLRLSPEEAVFLSMDLKVLEVYENTKILTQGLGAQSSCRNMLHIVIFGRMDGASVAGCLMVVNISSLMQTNLICWKLDLIFCNLLLLVIYRDGPGSHHAAAGIKIKSHVEPRVFIGMNRVLTNMKKALIIVTVDVPDDLDDTKPRCADSVHISMSTSITMFVERKMNQLKQRSVSM